MKRFIVFILALVCSMAVIASESDRRIIQTYEKRGIPLPAHLQRSKAMLAQRDQERATAGKLAELKGTRISTAASRQAQPVAQRSQIELPRRSQAPYRRTPRSLAEIEAMEGVAIRPNYEQLTAERLGAYGQLPVSMPRTPRSAAEVAAMEGTTRQPNYGQLAAERLGAYGQLPVPMPRTSRSAEEAEAMGGVAAAPMQTEAQAREARFKAYEAGLPVPPTAAPAPSWYSRAGTWFGSIPSYVSEQYNQYVQGQKAQYAQDLKERQALEEAVARRQRAFPPQPSMWQRAGSAVSPYLKRPSMPSMPSVSMPASAQPYWESVKSAPGKAWSGIKSGISYPATSYQGFEE